MAVTTIALNSAAWTDLGPGPIIAKPSSLNVFYAINAAMPTSLTGFPSVQRSQSNSIVTQDPTMHIYMLAMPGTSGVNVAVSPALDPSTAGQATTSTGSVSVTMPAGIALDSSLQSILAAVARQRVETVWTDDTGAFFIRVDIGGTVTIVDPSSGVTVAPGAGFRPAGGAAIVVDKTSFQAIAAGTGISTGDLLDHFVTTDPKSGAVVGHFWVNLSTEAVLVAAPASASITLLSPLPTGAATDASLQQIRALLAAVQVVDTVVQKAPADRGGLTTVKAASATVTAGGSGNAVGDVLTNAAGTFTVTAVSSGAVTAVTPLSPLALTALTSGALATTATTGSGTGCTLTPAYAPAPVQIAAANTGRRGFKIQNQSGSQMWMNGTAGTATADYHSLMLNPNDVDESPSHHSGTGAIFVIGTGAGQPFYAREW